MDEKYMRPPVFDKFNNEKRDFRSLGLIMWIYLGLSFVFSFVLVDNDSDIVSVVLTLLASLLTSFLGLKMTRTTLPKRLFKNKGSFRQWSKEFLLMNGFSMLTLLVIMILSSIFIMLTGKSFPQGSFEYDLSEISGWVLLLYVCVLGPVVEEIMFRGVILRTLKKYGHMFAIISSALMFGLFHMYVEQGAHAFVLGVILAYVSLKYDSLFVPILFHILNNSFTTFIEFSVTFTNIYIIFRLLCIFYAIAWLLKNIKTIQYKLKEGATYYSFYSHLFIRVSFILFFILFILETVILME